MNTVSIFGCRWTDIVFEGRNQAYGAYQLRRESARTTLSAFFYGLMILSAACGIFVLINLLSAQPALQPLPTTEIPTVRPVHLIPEIVQPTAPKPPSKSAIPAYLPSSEPEPEPEPAPKPETPANQPSGMGQEGNGAYSGGEPGGAAIVPPAPAAPPDAIAVPATLDRQPAFPGGLDDFYGFVGKNFRTLETEGQTIRVFVSFVIERDGSLSDIKVLRDPGFGAGKEAIRVLKSLRTKWEPGMIKGQPVRTSYTMPITVKPAE